MALNERLYDMYRSGYPPSHRSPFISISDFCSSIMSSVLPSATSTASAGAEPNCGSGGGVDTYHSLRIASIFIILTGSLFGASFPVLAKRSTWFQVPKAFYSFAKYFGSGVIIATAFIHLLAPALDELGSPCLAPAWRKYPYALAFSMFSVFCIFVVELVAFRWGTAKLTRVGISYDAHGHAHGSHAAHGPEGNFSETEQLELPEPGEEHITTTRDEHDKDLEMHAHVLESAAAQIIGVAILEFGVLLHSILIGLTLAVDPNFKALFVVIVFHQTFEGLGIGSRLAYLNLPPRYNWVRYIGAILYGVTTPIGIATGLGIKSTYNPGSSTASIVSGILDAISSGILLYTGLVELLAHEFLFNREMINASNAKIAYSLICMLSGSGIMALLGRWA